jgi:peptidylprolyl isomerase
LLRFEGSPKFLVFEILLSDGVNMKVLLALALGVLTVCGAEKPLTMADILEGSKASDWRAVDPENTIYMELEKGRVVIELAPEFAPKHVANLKALVREKYFDGLAILRAQDNYVVQWGDPNAEKTNSAKEIKTGKRSLPAEFERALDSNMEFTRLKDGDLYAAEVGHWRSFPVARDPKSKKTWLVHTYGMVGAGRDNAPDSGSGTELYVVIGHAPRQLDRNVTLLGRVVQGMELLSAMPRGAGKMGFYEKEDERAPIKTMHVAADMPENERTKVEVLRTDTQLFQRLVEARRNRKDEWYARPAGKIEIGNVPLPVRVK